MEWILLVLVLVAVMVGLSAGTYGRIRRWARNAIRDLQAQWGKGLRLATGCGILDGARRVPGVLALTADRLVYRAAVRGVEGEIPLRNIVEATVEEAARSRHGGARRYRRASVIVLRLQGGEERLFVVEQAHAKAWSEALTRAASGGARSGPARRGRPGRG